MKTIPTIGVALLLLSIAYSCKQTKENETADRATATEESVAGGKAVSSSAAIEKPAGRKFIRTADIKFKVKNVAQSTYAIENTVSKFGGFVTYTNLQSNISEKKNVQVSPDSTLETTKYIVENNITLRVPNTKLDTVIKTIARQVDYLDYRVIRADDASLKIMANELAQNRTAAHEKRVENDIDNKGKKLTHIMAAENDLLDKAAQSDNSKLDNLSLKDQVSFSTVTLALYQREMVKQELVANEKSVNAYRPHIGLQIWDSLKTGWFILESIIAFVARLWSLILIAILGIFLYRKYLRKPKKPVIF